MPEFTPVPRKYRVDGWTAERQRAFIDALADTGSVKHAARRINMSPEGAYYLRRQPGAEEFRAAWTAALDHGVQALVDVALERAFDGVPIPIYYKGEQCGEKRWYNDRLLMFLLKHHLPARYDPTPLPRGTRHPDTVAREAAENCPVCRERAEAEAADAAAPPGESKEDQAWLDEVLKRYIFKVQAERQHRLAGEVVAADYTLRQLTHIELILDCGGRGMQLIEAWTNVVRARDKPERWASSTSRWLDDTRRAIWERTGEPLRPAVPLGDTAPADWSEGGPTLLERGKAKRDCERRIAEVQAEWEAAATEEGWKAWKEGRG
ncbi:hypothetical protein HZY97_14760 [Sphingomonas sp. R-74633]|nr:hypothetical protein [Sphingomonas sp. R-74633]